MRLDDLKFPSILGFQLLCFIETEVNMKSSIGLSFGFCFSTFVLANPCHGAKFGE